MIILIPSYEPGAHLVPLVRAVRDLEPDARIVIVDDGSSEAFADVFADAARAGATVLRHPVNRGKGAALKTGLGFIADRHPGDHVVTADADGQHTPVDISRVAEALRDDASRGDTCLILGVRDFRGDVPLRSRVGNAVARGMFRAAAGWRASDTQTGLRGIPSEMLSWARRVPGDRFEYEIEMLLRLGRSGGTAREIPVETVYLEHNASSHFRPLIDSLRVTLPLLMFAGSSLIAFFIDAAALLLFASVLAGTTNSLATAIIASRIVSASANYFINRRFVFCGRGEHRTARHVLRYAVVATLLLASNIVWMEALTGFGLPLVIAKIFTETALFILSFGLQRRFVFHDPESDRQATLQDFTASKAGLRDPLGRSIRMDSDAPHIERTPT